MFYENERIARKNRRHLLQKAQDMIDDFKSRGLKPDEIVAAIEMFLAIEKCSEFGADVAKMAISILTKDKDEGQDT